MSFASEAKAEICRPKIERKCCAVAESYGVLLFCNTFSSEEIKVTTTSADFAERLQKLFNKAFGFGFDTVPKEDASGRRSFIIKDTKKLDTIFSAYGIERGKTLAHHVNFGVIEEECCRVSFIRGAFLAGGTVTDPEKRYHLELATSHKSVARETFSILLDINLSPKESSRGANTLLYFKQSDAIADFLTTIGASTTAMNVITAKVEKEMNNKITRRVNCDSANAEKTVTAAQEQIAAIRRFAGAYGLDALPEPLKDAALLRVANPEASLADLARLSFPEVSKSCLSHRLKKIAELAPGEEK